MGVERVVFVGPVSVPFGFQHFDIVTAGGFGFDFGCLSVPALGVNFPTNYGLVVRPFASTAGAFTDGASEDVAAGLSGVSVCHLVISLIVYSIYLSLGFVKGQLYIGLSGRPARRQGADHARSGRRARRGRRG